MGLLIDMKFTKAISEGLSARLLDRTINKNIVSPGSRRRRKTSNFDFENVTVLINLVNLRTRWARNNLASL